MLKSDVEIDGDMHVAETFSAILKDVDIDWEELLSKLEEENPQLFISLKSAFSNIHTKSFFLEES